ncbi:MarR family transcriptional regulator [Streptomyces sp. NPDC042319]|uniref:MarR family transcriptional regulator n=1 Tax=Streptomyces sp. NPDC042319 TaxID=3154332 RepID=UPI0033C6CDCA
MSDATTSKPRALHAVADPNPEPLGGLTGAPATIYTELARLSAETRSTVAELALAAGLGRSTTSKALATLEEHGLAVRTPGGHDGPRRTPDRWHCAPVRGAIGKSGHSSVAAQPEPSTADAPEPGAERTDQTDGPADENRSVNRSAPGDESATTANGPAKSVTPPGVPSGADAEQGTPKDGAASAPQNGSAGRRTPAQPIVLAGERKRLAPGALRQMVIDHLQAHPGDAFTATRLSRVIEKSSGAIANALVKLLKQGLVEQVSEKPRIYQLAGAEVNTD